MPKVRDMLANDAHESSRDFSSPHPEVVSSTSVGVEVELEDVWFTHDKVLRDLNYWHFHKEGSLRGQSAELVFYQPLANNLIVHALRELESFVRVPRLSGRCSVHVHVDCRDLELDELWSIILVSLVCEPVLYSYCKGRRGNLFCLPSETSYVTLLEMASSYVRLRAVHMDPFPKLRLALLRWPKYTGINFGALAKYGTIEYRMHGGTYKKNRILDWINILLSMHTFAKEHIFGITTLPMDLASIGSTALFEQIWPSPRIQKLLRARCREPVRSCLVQGIRAAMAVHVSSALIGN